MSKDFFKDALKSIKNSYAQCAEKGIIAGDVTGYMDTGSYVLNALVSGSVYKGLPDSKISGFAGASGVGKCARGSEQINIYYEK